MIRKLPGVNKWRVVARSGRNMGTYSSKGKAEVRLKQVERFSRRPRWSK
jgi:hypothetical protein